MVAVLMGRLRWNLPTILRIVISNIGFTVTHIVISTGLLALLNASAISLAMPFIMSIFHTTEGNILNYEEYYRNHGFNNPLGTSDV